MYVLYRCLGIAKKLVLRSRLSKGTLQGSWLPTGVRNKENNTWKSNKAEIQSLIYPIKN